LLSILELQNRSIIQVMVEVTSSCCWLEMMSTKTVQRVFIC